MKVHLANKFYFPLITPLLLLLSGCEFFYDPSIAGDAPSSPGSEWKRKKLELPQPTYQNPYTAADLSAEMSVANLLDMALFNNPSTRASWNAARAAAYAYHVSLSPYYPSIAYSGTITAESDTIGASSGSTATSRTSASPFQNIGITANTAALAASSQIDTIFNQVTMSWLMFDFGGRDAQAELARQALYSSNWQHNFVMQQVMLSVLNAYTSYQGNKALVENDEQDLKDAETTLKAALSMKRAGLATETDALQSLSLVEQAKTTLAQARGQEQTSLGELLIAVGLPADTKLSVQSLPQKLPVIELSGDISKFLEIAKRRRPDLGMAIAAVKEQEAQLAISFSSGMPAVSTLGQLSRLHFIHNPALDGHANFISIQITSPIFQGFYYYNQQREIRAQIQEALANVDVQLSQIASQVVTNYYAWTSALAALPSAEASVEYSQRAFRGFLSQYKVGTSSLLDVVNALTVLSNARAQLVVTRTQWAAALANLAYSAGILNDESGVWKNAPPANLTALPFTDNKAF